jgi:hypothetical protein
MKKGGKFKVAEREPAALSRTPEPIPQDRSHDPLNSLVLVSQNAGR